MNSIGLLDLPDEFWSRAKAALGIDKEASVSKRQVCNVHIMCWQAA